jgi:hypothetical protein
MVLLVGSIPTALCNFDVMPNIFISQYGLQLGTALEMLLLSFALAARFDEMKRAKEAAQAETLAVARQHDAELVQRVSERTAELTATNARLAESEARLHDLAHHDALTDSPSPALRGSPRRGTCPCTTRRSRCGAAVY